MSSLPHPPPLALYVHIPWCAKKCPYCDFNSHVSPGALPETAYLDALAADLAGELDAVRDRPVTSVFIGGGTPSLFSPEAIERLLSDLRRHLPLDDDVEITLEANPGTLEQGRLAEFRAGGVNRLSLGVQSFDDAALRRLGRIHSADEAHRAVETAHKAGFASLNLDLMYGLPGQTPEGARADLRTALSLEPQHISHYQLTIEPDTAFFNRPPELPPDDRIWAMQQAAQSELAQAGYNQYEVSAYARDGHRCRHNLNYWRFGDYLGIGAGAHQKVTQPDLQTVTRRWKHRLPADYMARAHTAGPVEGEAEVGEADRLFEFMLNALRLTQGFEAGLFPARTGLAWSVAEPALQQAVDRQLIEQTGGCIRPTETGRRFLNELLLLFMT